MNPATALEEAEKLSLLAQNQKFDELIAGAENAIVKCPNEACFYFLLGYGLQHKNKIAEAIHNYAKAGELRPDYVDAHVNHAMLLEKDGDDVGAIAQYHRALTFAPDSAMILLNLGIRLVEHGQPDEALAYVQRAAALDPQNITAAAYLGIISKVRQEPYKDFLHVIVNNTEADYRTTAVKIWAALMLGRPDLAYSFKTTKLNIPDYDIQDTFYHPLDLRERLAALPALSGIFPQQNSRPLLYAGADGVYAERFARQLIDSAFTHSPDCDFHLHLMNVRDFDPEAAFKAFPKDRLTWTVEKMQPATKIFYAPRRWLRLAQILHKVDRTAILVDADCIVRGNIAKALPENFDVLVYERPNEIFAHQMINAGFFAVKPGGRDFVDFLAAYILHFEEAGQSKWFDDQLDIVIAREWFKRNVPGMVIKSAPAHIMEWNKANRERCIIWHAKGALKAVS